MNYPLKEEQLKYDVLYRKGYNHGPVKRTMNWGLPRMLLCHDDIVDLGCGHALAKDFFPNRKSYTGLDISRVQIDKNKAANDDLRDSYYYANLADLKNYKDKQFDLGISVDVLEHMPPEFVPVAIKEMVRICENLIVSIALTAEKSHKSHDGSPLHLCIKPRDWWFKLFQEYIKIEDTGSAGVENLVLVCGPKAIRTGVETQFLKDSKNGRLLLDGTFVLLRRNLELEKQFDKRHVRLEGERRWEPRILYKYGIKSIPNASGPVYIVGKGPTLDNLEESCFDPAGKCPIICVNEALLRVEALDLNNPIYLIQHDNLHISPKKETTIPILEKEARHFYPHIQTRYIYDKHKIDLPVGLTCLAAIHIAKLMEATQINMVCFDAATHEDCGYADVVGYNVRTKADGEGPAGSRFLSHRNHIIDVVGDTKMFWLTPDRGGAVAYTPQLLQGNHEGHREHALEGC